MNAQSIGSTFGRALAFAVAFTLASVPAGGLIAAAEPAAETSLAAPSPAGARALPRKATADEVERYSTREKKASPELAKFAGGDRTILVISGTTIVIILLVVIIVLLV